MGLSRLRLFGIVLASLVFGWTLFRSNSDDTTAAPSWHTFQAEEITTEISHTAQQAHDAKKVADENAALNTIANVTDAVEKEVDSKDTNDVLKTVDDDTFGANSALAQKAADSQKSHDIMQDPQSEKNVQEHQSTTDAKQLPQPETPKVTQANDEQNGEENAAPPGVLTIPVREPTEEEKEEARKKQEREKEEGKRKLEQEHEALRDASLRRLQNDPQMRARINVTLEDIGVIMRTGKDVKHRLISPLSTWASARTPDNLVIFSDQEGDFNGWKLHDAIKPWIDRPAIRDTPAAKFWREANSGIGDDPAEIKDKGKRFNGWNLDALKFVSAVHLGYEQLRQKREFKWYIFVDDDTYWHLPTLVTLLSNLDYEMEYYTGGVSYFGIAFAHGGAGAVASAGAMKKRFIDHADTIAKYHDIGATAQYGDTNLARAFEAVGIYFDHSFRENFNGENAMTRPLDRQLICQHVVTFHHLSMDFFGPFHERVKNLPILRYIDVMAALADPEKPMTAFWHRKDWTYNLDREDIGTADEAKGRRDRTWTFTVPEHYRGMLDTKACQEMCRDNEKCVGWTYIEHERSCLMSEWFKLGQERKECTSGIDALKLADWADTCSSWWPKQF